jgi:hypothetical protein
MDNITSFPVLVLLPNNQRRGEEWQSGLLWVYLLVSYLWIRPLARLVFRPDHKERANR